MEHFNCNFCKSRNCKHLLEAWVWAWEGCFLRREECKGEWELAEVLEGSGGGGVVVESVREVEWEIDGDALCFLFVFVRGGRGEGGKKGAWRREGE